MADVDFVNRARYERSTPSATARRATSSGSPAFPGELVLNPQRAGPFDYGSVFKNTTMPSGAHVRSFGVPTQQTGGFSAKQNQAHRRVSDLPVGSSPYVQAAGSIAAREPVPMSLQTRAGLMDNIAALEALNPERAQSFLQSSQLSASTKLEMLDKTNAVGPARAQLHGDIVGMSRIQAREGRQGQPIASVQRCQVWDKVVADINASGVDAQRKAEMMRRVPTSSLAKAELMHAAGSYKEASHYSSREASTAYA